MKITNITPPHLQCIVGACPAVFETDDGKLLIIGKKLSATAIPEHFQGKVGQDEEIIEIDQKYFPQLLSN